MLGFATLTKMAKRYALLLSNSVHDSPSLTELRSPGTDVALLSGTLEDEHIGGYIVSSVSDEPWSTIQEAIGDFFIDKMPDDLLLLYISCHGLKDPDGNLYFAARNTDLRRLSYTSIPAAYIANNIKASRSRRILVVIDACFSGAFPHEIGFKGTDSVDLAKLGVADASGRGRAILTATSSIEYAFEGDHRLDRTPSPSKFTEIIVRGLQTGAADADNDGVVTVSDLHAYVTKEVADLPNAQTPQLHAHGLEGKIPLAWSPRRRMSQELPQRVEVSTLEDLLEEALDSMDRTASGLDQRGIVTGFDPLDELIGGMRGGDLIGVYGTTGIGKTTFALTLACTVAIRNGLPALFLSTDLSREDLIFKIFSAEARVPLSRIQNGRMTDDDWRKIALISIQLAEAPMGIACANVYNVDDVRQAIAGFKETAIPGSSEPRLLVVDPLAFINDNGSRIDKRKLTHQLKRLATDANIVILFTCLTTDTLLNMHPRPPKGIEEHSDILIGLHRDDMYERDTPRAGEADLFITKNRRGQNGTVIVVFQGHLARFVQLPT